MLVVVLAVVLAMVLALTLTAALAALACGASCEAGRHADHAMAIAVPRQSAAAAGPRAVLKSVLAFLGGRQH